MSQNIYDPAYVKSVFDKCSGSYRYWSNIASFGFVWLWRRQCIAALPDFTSENAVIADLMAGTGEVWPTLVRRHPKLAKIIAIDISSGMVQAAVLRLHAMRADRIQITEANVLTVQLPAASVDALVCGFGLKTFDKDQQMQIAKQVARVLKPSGVFSFVEASDPKGWLFRPLYNFYLRVGLPTIEHLFLRGAQDFAMLGIYSREFQNCSHFVECLKSCGLEAEMRTYFFGCATGVVGQRQAAS